MGLANIMGQGYQQGYTDGNTEGATGGGSPKAQTIRIVVGHHHTGDSTSGGGCYTEQVGQTCGANIHWGDQYTIGSEGSGYRYGRDGVCTNGHHIHNTGWSAGTAPNLAYQPCRQMLYHYELPADHPAEDSFVRNVDIGPGEDKSKLVLTANEKVTGVEKV